MMELSTSIMVVVIIVRVMITKTVIKILSLKNKIHQKKCIRQYCHCTCQLWQLHINYYLIRYHELHMSCALWSYMVLLQQHNVNTALTIKKSKLIKSCLSYLYSQCSILHCCPLLRRCNVQKNATSLTNYVHKFILEGQVQ